jgi:hypothetical protein
MLLSLGSVVKAKVKTGVCDKEELGIVVFTYGEYGTTVVFENGNYDGFSQEEQGEFLIHVANMPFRYRFTNVMCLSSDFAKGTFSPYFAEARKILAKDNGNTPY